MAKSQSKLPSRSCKRVCFSNGLVCRMQTLQQGIFDGIYFLVYCTLLDSHWFSYAGHLIFLCVGGSGGKLTLA